MICRVSAPEDVVEGKLAAIDREDMSRQIEGVVAALLVHVRDYDRES